MALNKWNEVEKKGKERKMLIIFLEQDTGLEPAPSAWKADMLATDTNPALDRLSLFIVKKAANITSL